VYGLFSVPGTAILLPCGTAEAGARALSWHQGPRLPGRKRRNKGTRRNTDMKKVLALILAVWQ